MSLSPKAATMADFYEVTLVLALAGVVVMTLALCLIFLKERRELRHRLKDDRQFLKEMRRKP